MKYFVLSLGSARLPSPLAALAFAGVFALAACGDDGPGATTDADAGVADAAIEAGTDAHKSDSHHGDASVTLVTVKCPNAAMTPPTTGTCSVTKGTGTALLIRGEILAPGKILQNGHLLIDSGKIVCSDCDCSTATGYSTATILECAKGVVTPGLINTHDHITYTQATPATTDERYDHRHEWRLGLSGHTKISVSANSKKEVIWWGELRQILAGTTSLMGSGGADMLLRNLDKDNEGLGKSSVDLNTFPLGDSSGTLLKTGCSYPTLPSVSTVKAEIAYVPHVSEGGRVEARNEFLCLSGGQSGAVDVTLSTTGFIHSVGLTAADAAVLASHGTRVVWSPRSNISLYGYTAQVELMDNLGVGIALGTDWTASGSVNLLRELACADSFNTTYLDGHFSDYQLWKMVTANAADVAGLSDVIGHLAEGYFADVAIYDGSSRSGHAAVIRASVADVVLVMRGGTVLYGDKDLVAALDSGGGADCDALSDCLSEKLACVKPEIGITLSELQTAVGSSIYGLYFCDTPDSEPTCVPSRPSEYDGTASSTDSDGDGVPDSTDNCPKVFNPPRLMDGGKQPDSDGDKVGDACDPCPFDADTTDCKSSPSTTDKDGDSIDDTTDNCPSISNKDQTDTDGDKIGDACDDCPDYANPGGTACPFLIKDLRDRSLGKRPSDGSLVSIKNATVIDLRTLKSGSYGFYVREGTAAYEAIFVYTKATLPVDATGDALVLGDVVSLEGTISEYNNVDEIDAPTAITKTGSGDITAVAAKTADLQPGSTTAEEMESQLVSVATVTVAAMVGTSTTDAFWVADDGSTCTGTTPACAKVNDYLYDSQTLNGQPAAAAGDTFTTITGIVNGFKKVHTLEPRDSADLEI
jgi:large repetitive protein